MKVTLKVSILAFYDIYPVPDFSSVMENVLVFFFCILELISLPTLYGVGNGNPLQYSCLENAKDRGPWRATVPGAAKRGT